MSQAEREPEEGVVVLALLCGVKGFLATGEAVGAQSRARSQPDTASSDAEEASDRVEGSVCATGEAAVEREVPVTELVVVGVSPCSLPLASARAKVAASSVCSACARGRSPCRIRSRVSA